MKIGARTLSILKNFAVINGSIVVDPGNMLWTCAIPDKNFFARATTAEEFETPFAIFDIPQFLSLASVAGEDPDFLFQEKKVVIKGEGRKAQFTYAARSLLPPIPRKIKDFESDFEAKMDKKAIASLIEAANVLKSSQLVFRTRNGNAEAVAVNTQSPTSHEFVLSLGECPIELNVMVDKDLFKVLPGDYTFCFTKAPLLKLKSDDVTYWMAGSV